MEGILLIDKPKGITSSRVVQKVKRLLGVSKAGHTGTLDPLATGVLPVALGEGTKVVPFLDESLKIYEVEARLGLTTDTFDLDGTVLEEKDPGLIDRAALEGLLPKMTGKVAQRPPVYSAIKVGGRPLYRYARRGQEVTPPMRTIEVHSLELLEYVLPQFRLRVECSRGTYIRSLISEIGSQLGCGATVTALKRLRSGPFCLEGATPLEALLAGGPLDPKKLLSPAQCLAHLPQLDLSSSEEAARVRQGVPLYALRDRLEEKNWSDPRVLLTFEGRAQAVLKVEKTGDFRFLRVFS